MRAYGGSARKIEGRAFDDETGKRISTNVGSQPRLASLAGLSGGRGGNVGRFMCIVPSFLWKEVARSAGGWLVICERASHFDSHRVVIRSPKYA